MTRNVPHASRPRNIANGRVDVCASDVQIRVLAALRRRGELALLDGRGDGAEGHEDDGC